MLQEAQGQQNATAGPSSPPPSLEPAPNNAMQIDSAPAEEKHTIRPDQQDITSMAELKPPVNLKPLTALLWPPEPDPSIFTDPLKRDDPKPLRHEELLRIATSPQLRHLLTATSLPKILLILDAIPSPHARQNSLARILGLDPESLAKPTTSTILSQRDSPPPLGDLLDTLAGKREEDDRGWNEQGWWLGHSGSKEGRVWIGEEEKKIMRLFAGAVCQAIDGGEGEELSWGQGGLSWEV